MQKVEFNNGGIRLEFHHFIHFDDLPADSRGEQIIAGIRRLEQKLSKTDDQIAQFKADADAQFATISTSLDTIASAQANIAADEQKILAELAAIPTDGLSQASQDSLAGVITKLTGVAGQSQTQATALQTLADSIPDAPAA